MCRLCDHPDRTFDDYVAEVETMLADHGHLIQGILTDGSSPPWAYTVGLTGQGRPELIVTGLPHPVAAAVLNKAARMPAEATDPGARPIMSGRTFECVTVVAPVPALTVAEAVYGPNVVAVQLVHADSLGVWPWDSDYAGDQPLLGLPMS
jgi:hypothetical protein